MTLVGTRDINNIEVEIHASHHGSWSIQLPESAEEDQGKRHLATDPDSLEKAVNKARLEIKKREVKVSVPFKTLDGRRGIASGRHARSRDKILTKIAGHSEQLSNYAKVLKHDTPKDVTDHLKEIVDEKRRLDREERELMNKWSFNLSTNVDAAIREAAEEAAAS